MEIGKLIAYFQADTSHFDAGAKRVESSAHSLEGSLNKVTGVMKEIGAASVVLEGPFGGVSSRLRGLSTLGRQFRGRRTWHCRIRCGDPRCVGADL